MCERESIPTSMPRTVKTRKFKLLYFPNETYYGNGNLNKDLLFVYLQPSVNLNSQNLAILTLQFDDVTIKPSMCHGRVYTGSFVLDYHALYLQHFTSIEYKSHIELFRNGSVHELYRLKALITLEQVITSVVEKKNNLNKHNFEVYRKTRNEDRGSGIGDRGSVKKKTVK